MSALPCLPLRESMTIEDKDARIQELEAEVQRLKTANCKLRDKLSAANRKVNRAWRDSYENVDFHDDRR